MPLHLIAAAFPREHSPVPETVPAYAGIPITHRDFTSTFTVITGHEEPGKETSNINCRERVTNMRFPKSG